MGRVVNPLWKIHPRPVARQAPPGPCLRHFCGEGRNERCGASIAFEVVERLPPDEVIKVYPESTGTTAIWSETVAMTEKPGETQKTVLHKPPSNSLRQDTKVPYR